MCPAHSLEAAHRLSHTRAALRQSKASKKLEDSNAYNYPQREMDKTIYYSGVMLSSLPVIPGLSSGKLWRKISSTPHRNPQRQEFAHCEAGTAPLTGDTGLRTDAHAHLHWVVRSSVLGGGVMAYILAPLELLTGQLTWNCPLKTSNLFRPQGLCAPCSSA